MTPTIGHRRQILSALLALLTLTLIAIAAAQAPLPLVEVWKSPSCGCCGDWIDHLQAEGFTVKRHDVGNTQAREDLGMPQRYGSCHSAKVGRYAIEGHVPAEQIKRLLAEQSDAIGLAVPGMPIGSPGMDGPAYGHQVDPYQVLLILKDGSARVYAAYGNEAAPVPAHTDHTADTPANNTPAQEHTKSEETPEGWAQGNIRRINLLQGKLTLRHGPLPTVDMPPIDRKSVV